MAPKRLVVRDIDGTAGEVRVGSRESFRTSSGELRFSYEVAGGGPAGGVEVVRIAGERIEATLLPTRGMGLHHASCGGVRFGWDSPVAGPIHPALVPLHDPTGLGWLEGFDELLVRCGLESNGAPELDDEGRVRYPLHGRIANLPARSLEVLVDLREGWIELVGIVTEARLFFTNLQLVSRTRVYADRSVIEVVDTVTNRSSQRATTQMLYHINVGRPVLSKGAQLLAPIEELAPKDGHAAEGLDHWATYPGPQAGYAEQVYFSTLYQDAEQWTRALLRSSDHASGLGVSFDAGALPYFIQWKCTQADADGYVTGLEPATNFPNPRGQEERAGRVVHLEGGQSTTYRVNLELLTGEAEVAEFAESIERIAEQPTIHPTPKAEWSGG